MRICIVGPVPPFKSGIARHTHALAKALAARPDLAVTVFSFSRQYPRILYPGGDDRTAAARPAEYETRYLLDSMNPATWRTTAQRISSHCPDLVIMPAWTFFLAPCLGTVARQLRRRGHEICMLVHNVIDHEGASWKTALSKFQLGAADRFVVHNAPLARELRALAPDRAISVFPHPIYDDYPTPCGALPRKRSLELLFFGHIRRYKGLDIALYGLAASQLDDVRLSVVGEFWDLRTGTEGLIRKLGLTECVELTGRYVSDQEAAEYFHRADAVLAPYRSATGSGVAALAQYYRRPVIASNVDGLKQSIIHKKTGWLFESENIDALAVLLRENVTRKRAAQMWPALDAQCKELSWDRFASVVLGAHGARRQAEAAA